MSQRRVPANLRNITPIHGVSPPNTMSHPLACQPDGLSLWHAIAEFSERNYFSVSLARARRKCRVCLVCRFIFVCAVSSEGVILCDWWTIWVRLALGDANFATVRCARPPMEIRADTSALAKRAISLAHNCIG